MLGINPLPKVRQEVLCERALVYVVRGCEGVSRYKVAPLCKDALLCKDAPGYKMAMGLMQRLVFFIAATLGFSVVQASEPGSVGSDGSVVVSSVPVQSRIFELSTRHLSDHFCAINVSSPGFRVHELTHCQLVPSSLEEAIPQEDVLTIVYVHGNFMSRETALERVRILDHRLKPYAKSDYRILVLSWPSQWEGKTIRDVYSNAECADDHSLYVAWLLYQLRAQSRVSLLGFSFGSRAVTGGLHLDAGGRLPGLRPLDLPYVPRATPYHLGLLAPAIDRGWLDRNGLHSSALTYVDDFVNMYNSKDPVLRRFRFIDRLTRPTAAGYSGFIGLSNARVAGPLNASPKVQQFDCGSIIGTTHAEKSYYAECPYFRVMVDTLLWNHTDNVNSCTSCATK